MPPKTEKALLFDIDGTLADTDSLHLEAFNLILGPRGHVFDHERFTRELQGFSTASICERYLANELPTRQVGIMEEKEEAFRNLVSGRIKPTPGLMTLLNLADQADIPMVAVTNAPRLNAEMLLAGLGIMHRFKAVIIGDGLPHGKPNPMPYLEGLRAVDAAPNLSIAFEDSRSGVKSASSAGIATVGIRTSLSHTDMIEAGAIATAKTFDEPELMSLIAATMNW
jgi:HAD superfamily hydrolase (TIGR01509 family)